MSEQTYSTFGNDTGDNEKGRDRWPSRIAFYLAAVGSAVGFGNVWRFPALAKYYGGGAFFIPYVMALFLIGLPTIILEIALGQYYQTSNVGVYGSFHARMRGVGMSSVACAFMLVIYYSMLLTWVANAFFDSFGKNDPWAKDETTGESAVAYFTGDIIGMSTLGDDLRPTRFVPANIGYSALVWFCTFLCLAFGMRWTGRVAYLTMGLPILLLFIFLGRAVSLEGSEDGIREYIGRWDLSILKSMPDVWSTAVSQIFFSLSVTMGTMVAYGSHCPRGEPAFVNAVTIGISNCLFSFVAGFAVFASLGHLAHLEQKDVNEIPYSGFGLVFGTWPVVLGTLRGGEHWVRLLFFNLFLLGIDSAFSILEAPVAVLFDWFGSERWPKWKITAAATVLAYLLSLMYATDAGFIWLNTIDFYINFVFLFVGLVQCFGAGWIFGIEEQLESLGSVVWVWMITNFGSITVASIIWFGFGKVLGGFLALIIGYVIGTTATFYMLKQKMQEEPDKFTMGSIVYELTLSNVMKLHNELSSVVGYIPSLWAFGIKNFIPHVLLILFINLACSDNGDEKPKFGNYENYVKWPFQYIGILCVVFAGLIFIVGIIMPTIFEGADAPYLEMKRQPEEAMKSVEPAKDEKDDFDVEEAEKEP